MTIKLIVNGANGRMGQVFVKTTMEHDDLSLVAETGRQDNLVETIQQTQADVVVDLTTADAAYGNALAIIQAGARPVIGTSGLSLEQVKELQAEAARSKLGGIIAPNFSIGAVLMMRYAKDAARYFNNIEVIEHHHDKKADAPSGTAMKTAQLMAESRQQKPAPLVEKELLPGARGANHEEIHIHSVRLPGRVAHQEVIFGGTGEILTIRNDAIDRSCYMPGIVLSCRKVMELDHLVYGLEDIL